MGETGQFEGRTAGQDGVGAGEGEPAENLLPPGRSPAMHEDDTWVQALPPSAGADPMTDGRVWNPRCDEFSMRGDTLGADVESVKIHKSASAGRIDHAGSFPSDGVRLASLERCLWIV